MSDDSFEGHEADDGVGDAADAPADGRDDYLARREERLAEQRQRAILAGRRKGGAAGAALAGAMSVVQEIYEGKVDDDPPVIVEADSDPDDLDRDGFSFEIDGIEIESRPD